VNWAPRHFDAAALPTKLVCWGRFRVSGVSICVRLGCGLCAVWHLRHGKLAAQSLAAATAAGEGQEQAAGGGGGGGGPSVADCADFADAVLELVHAAAPLGSAADDADDEASLLWAQARTHFGWHCGHRLWATSDGAGDTASSTLLAQAMLRRLCADVRAAPEPHRRLIGVEYVLDLARLCYWQQSPETSPCPSSSSSSSSPPQQATSSSSSSPPQQATGPCTGPELRGELLALCDAMVMGGAGSHPGPTEGEVRALVEAASHAADGGVAADCLRLLLGWCSLGQQQLAEGGMEQPQEGEGEAGQAAAAAAAATRTALGALGGAPLMLAAAERGARTKRPAAGSTVELWLRLAAAVLPRPPPGGVDGQGMASSSAADELSGSVFCLTASLASSGLVLRCDAATPGLAPNDFDWGCPYASRFRLSRASVGRAACRCWRP
jgi:hypothetical protein